MVGQICLFFKSRSETVSHMAESNNAILGTRFQIFNQLRGVHPNAETDFTVCIIPQSQENQISIKKTL